MILWVLLSSTLFFVLLSWLQSLLSFLEFLVVMASVLGYFWVLRQLCEESMVTQHSQKKMLLEWIHRLSKSRENIELLRRLQAQFLIRNRENELLRRFVETCRHQSSMDAVEEAFRQWIGSMWDVSRYALHWNRDGEWESLFSYGQFNESFHSRKILRDAERPLSEQGASLTIPIWFQHEALGILQIHCAEDSNARHPFETIVPFIQMALLFVLLRQRNLRIREQDSFSDPQTGCWSRRAIWEWVDQELKRSIRSPKVFSLLEIRLMNANVILKRYTPDSVRTFWSGWMNALHPFFYDTDLLGSDEAGSCLLFLPGANPVKVAEKIEALIHQLNETSFAIGMDSHFFQHEIRLIHAPTQARTLESLRHFFEPVSEPTRKASSQ